MRPSPVVLALAGLLATAAGAEGEIYRWTDSAGGVHFSHEISDVPEAQRDAAMRGTRPGGPSRLQTFGEGGDAGPAPAAAPNFEALLAPAPQRRSASLARGGEVRIPFVKHGTLMMVMVRLNDSVEAPFLIDTGASGISIPDRVARDLGIRIDADTPRMQVQTASGIVAEPLVELDSVQVGGARVEHLGALVNSAMEVGLLGGTFFNNFVYQVDAAQGVITLRTNDGVRGGLSESQWRERFGQMRDEIDRLALYIDEQDASDGRLAQLHRNLAALRGELEALDREATLAGVPQNWRE
jgi:clan AA aspartic protease (TIGR02281 family)